MDIAYSKSLAIPIREPPNSFTLIAASAGSALRSLVYWLSWS
jgi:hypothetical protein